jgi:chemotaxis protein methyltransferase CheR
LPGSLIESELFGHERGSFTGAHARKLGRFEVADGSSLFLDEISELPLELQAKMLRVIEDGEFERVGGSKTIKVDVRIIAATNRNLEEEVLEGRFRKDLWYRLNVFPITIPPLRERDEDISLLVQYYMDLFSRKHGKQISSITESSMKVMQGHAWPGNVRELANFLERSVISTSGSTLRLAGDLKQNHQSSTANHKNHKSLHDMERDYIVEVLEKTNWKVSGKNSAVEILKLDRSTLRNKMNKLGIRKPGSSI